MTVTRDAEVISTAFVLLTPRVDLGGRSLWFTTHPSAGTFRTFLARPSLLDGE